jgi:hypothetical protein
VQTGLQANMRRYFFFLLLASLAWADTVAVEVRENEVWLIRNGQPAQLTRDGKTKLQAVLSIARDRVAYYDQCVQGENCLPSVVILDLDGNRLQSFQPRSEAMGQSEPCASVLDISWVSDRVMAVECHLNPSVSEYLEIDLPSGKTAHDFLGYGFARSPDSRHVAHVGPIVHFAPPYAQSNYLVIDDITVYPLPKGVKPVVQRPFENSVDVVREAGPKSIGIHSFIPRFSWSPDSKRVAFFDCVFDWVETGASDGGGSPTGNPTSSKCSIAVVSLNGAFTLIPLRDIPSESLDAARVSWTGTGKIRVTYSSTKDFLVP